MAISENIKHRNICGGTTPHLCAHNYMCFGFEEYCSEKEDKIQNCLPSSSTDALTWCRRFALNESAWLHPQCANACFTRFNTTYLQTPDCDGNGNLNLLWIVGLVCIIFVLMAFIGILGWNLYQKRLTALRLKESREQTDTRDDGQPLKRVIDMRQERQISQEEELVDGSDSESVALVDVRTERQQRNPTDVNFEGRSIDGAELNGTGGESAETPGSDTTSASSMGFRSDSGYDSNAQREANGDAGTTGQDQTNTPQNQHGRSGTATQDGPPCRNPNPMPSTEGPPGKVCPSGTTYQDSQFH